MKQRLVTYEEAVKHSTSPSDFALLFRGVSGSASGGWPEGAQLRPREPAMTSSKSNQFEK